MSNFCGCKKRIPKYATTCKACHAAMLLENAKAYVTVHNTGVCPLCGLPLIFNNSLPGGMWLQCRGYGRNKQCGDKDCGYQIIANQDLVSKLLSKVNVPTAAL